MGESLPCSKIVRGPSWYLVGCSLPARFKDQYARPWCTRHMHLMERDHEGLTFTPIVQEKSDA